MIFSADRVRAKGSNFISVIPTDAKFVKVDDNTVDVVLSSPNPILISQWDGWYIMDKKWCEEHNAVAPTPASATTPSYASLERKRHRPLHHQGEPSARREDRVQGQPELVAQARA